jgi:carbon storage regulator
VLHLRRKRGQAIQIGPDIRVLVEEITPGRVTLGIEAPCEIPVHREEVGRDAAPPAK